MADDIDIANDLIDSEISRALSKMQMREDSLREATAIKFCVECGEAIPEARQKLRFKYCVPCAEEAERRKSLFADY